MKSTSSFIQLIIDDIFFLIFEDKDLIISYDILKTLNIKMNNWVIFYRVRIIVFNVTLNNMLVI